MKSLAQITTLAFVLTLGSFAQAFVPGLPQLKCRDTSIMIPEQKVLVQVYNPTKENPYSRVRVVKEDMNNGMSTLFDGNVTETSEVRGKTYDGYGLTMKLAETADGYIQGTLAVEEAGQQVQSYDVNCEVMFNLMNAGAKKPGPPVDQL